MNLASIGIKATIAIVVAAMGLRKDPAHPKRRYAFWILSLLITAGAVVDGIQQHRDSIKSDALSSQIVGGISGINSRLDEEKKQKESQKAQHREIIAQLTKFIAEAGKVKSNCGPWQDAAVEKWSLHVQWYLRSKVGTEYEERFKTMRQTSSICFQQVGSYIFILDKFIQEFRD